MSKFSVGEIVDCVSGENIGDEGEIISVGYILENGTKKDYGVKFPTKSNAANGMWGCHEISLRKRKPPREELGDWESLESNIGWKRPVEVA